MQALMKYLVERREIARRFRLLDTSTELTMLINRLGDGDFGELVELEPVTYADRAEALVAGAKRLQAAAVAERRGFADVKASLQAARKAVCA